MGYNGNNRGYSRRRNGHRGAYRSGQKLLNNTIFGLLGLGAMAAQELGNAAQNTPHPQGENEPSGLGCLIPAAIILVPLNVIGLMIGGFPLVGWAITVILVMLLYSVFSECSLSVKKLPICAKTIFWIALAAFCLACSYWIFDWAMNIGGILPYRAKDITGEVVWFNLSNLGLWLIGGAFPLSACIIGYLAGIHKAKKKTKPTAK